MYPALFEALENSSSLLIIILETGGWTPARAGATVYIEDNINKSSTIGPHRQLSKFSSR
jgi:hypothetical protein